MSYNYNIKRSKSKFKIRRPPRGPRILIDCVIDWDWDWVDAADPRRRAARAANLLAMDKDALFPVTCKLVTVFLILILIATLFCQDDR